MRPLRFACAWAAVYGVLSPPPAFGQTAEADAARATAPTNSVPASRVILLNVHSDAPELTADRMRDGLRGLLDATIVLDATHAAPSGALTVTYRPSRRELAVSYDEPNRGAFSRVVEAPADLEEAVRAAALLATSLVRDEAEDLLGPRAAPVAPAPLSSSAAAVATVVATPLPAAPPPSPRIAPFVLSFFHPLSTNYGEPSATTRLHLNLLYGYVGGLEGFSFGTATAVGGTARGIALAWLWNSVGKDAHGLQLAGLANKTAGPFTGWQAALVYGHAGGGMVGLQTALVTSSRGAVHGVQLGAVNFAAGNVDGVQIGLVNVGGIVRGVQLGLVNVADDIEGVPIGLVNVTKSGGVHPVVWSSLTSVANVGIKFSTRYTYSLFSGSAHRDRGHDVFGPGVAFGMRLPIERVVLESDVGTSFLFGGPLYGVSEREGLRDDLLRSRFRVSIGVELHRHLSFFVGGGLTLTTRFRQPAEGFTIPSDGIVSPEETTNALAPELFGGIQL